MFGKIFSESVKECPKSVSIWRKLRQKCGIVFVLSQLKCKSPFISMDI